jgi:hypothetical protein
LWFYCSFRYLPHRMCLSEVVVAEEKYVWTYFILVILYMGYIQDDARVCMLKVKKLVWIWECVLQVSWTVNSVILNVKLPQITVLRYHLVEQFQCFVGTWCLYHKGIRIWHLVVWSVGASVPV